MKIVVIGGKGLIGSKVVNILNSQGHAAVSASPSSGVNTITGEGLENILKGAEVVIDLSNTTAFDEKTSVEFFQKSSENLIKAEKNAGVKHHIVLSIVGTEKLSKDGYFHAKYIQEELIKASGIPYTIVKATQFFEFLNAIALSALVGNIVKLPPVNFQPIAGEDVASIIADVAVYPALNKDMEIAGPEKDLFPNYIRRYLKLIHDPKTVEEDVQAKYFGMSVNENSLVPEKNPKLGKITLEVWLKNQNVKLF